MRLKPDPSTLIRFGRPLLGLLLAGFVLGVAWLAVSQWQSDSNRAALQQLDAESERVQRLDRLLLQLLDAESGVRGYILTRDPTYLGAFQEGPAAIEQTLAALRADYQADGNALARIDRIAELVPRRWEVMRQGIERGSAGRISPGTAPGGLGKNLTDELRGIIGTLRGETIEASTRTLIRSFARFEQARALNIVLGSGVLLLLALLVLVLYRQVLLREKLAEALRVDNERLQHEVAERTRELSNLATYLTNAREAEKARLARELHDELGALMTAAKLDAAAIARKLPQETIAPLRKRFDRLLETLDQGIAIKRRVVSDLRPPLLADLGLIEALRSLAESIDLGEADGRVMLDLPQDMPDLPPSLSLALFRLVQESLTNIVRHARATRAVVRISVDDGQVLLEIEDDGIGFEPARLGNARHGLAGMAHRVQMFSGRLSLQSAPGKGTSVRAAIPIPSPT